MLAVILQKRHCFYPGVEEILFTLIIQAKNSPYLFVNLLTSIFYLYIKGTN